MALELAHLEVRWSRGRCARRDVCVHTTISSGRRLCFWGEDRFFAGALHLSHKQGRAVPQARAQVPPHTGPIPSAARHVAHHQGPRSSPLAPPIHDYWARGPPRRNQTKFTTYGYEISLDRQRGGSYTQEPRPSAQVPMRPRSDAIVRELPSNQNRAALPSLPLYALYRP